MEKIRKDTIKEETLMNLNKILNQMLQSSTGLEKHVLEYILETSNTNYSDDVFSLLEDIQRGLYLGVVSHLIYYEDTNKFYDQFESEIWDLLEEQSEEMGSNNVIDFIGSFNGAKDVSNIMQFKNLLAWYAFEETAYMIYGRLQNV